VYVAPMFAKAQLPSLSLAKYLLRITFLPFTLFIDHWRFL